MLGSARDLFIFNMGELRDMEITAARVVSTWADRVQAADLANTLRDLARDSQAEVDNVDACLTALGASPLSRQALIVDAMRETFQRVTGMQPSPEAFDLFAADAARRVVSYAATSYQHMADWALLMGEVECAQHLRLNGTRKTEWTSRLENTGYQLAKSLIADQAAGRDSSRHTHA